MPVPPPFVNWSAFAPAGRELEYLIDAFRSGWISGGAYVERLEQALEDVFAGSQAFAVSNGTAALQLAFQTLGVKPGDRVIVPSFCFQAAGNVLTQLGALPVFCDVDPLTWNQTVETIEQAAGNGAAGVVVVHNYGFAAPVAEICAWAEANGLWVVEDCAEAWFSRYQGKYLGCFGRLATFSMHATKTISSGEGGVVLASDTSLTSILKLLRSHGLDRARVHYLHALAGNNYRLSNVLAAIAFGQLEARSEIVRRQDENAARFAQRLRGLDVLELQRPLVDADNRVWAVGVRIAFHLLTITRDDLMLRLRDAGVETRPGFYPASAHGYYPAATEIHATVAERLSADVIALPCPTNLNAEAIDRVCSTLCELLETYRKCGTGYALVAGDQPGFTARVGRFAASLVQGRTSFRYFVTRDESITANHVVTLLLECCGHDVGYGHLENDSGITWLGIAVADGQTGKGWGRILMQALLSKASECGIAVVQLGVDRGNVGAQALYRQFGFVAIDDGSEDAALTMRKSIEPTRRFE